MRRNFELADPFLLCVTASTTSSAAWERFGEVDPYWAVLTDDKFRAGRYAK